MNYEQAKNIKKQWNGKANAVKDIIETQRTIYSGIQEQLQVLENKLQDYDHIKKIKSLFDDERGEAETTTITTQHGTTEYKYIINQDDDIDIFINDVSRCLTAEKHKQKYTNALVKMYSYAYNQDLANLVKYYNQVKELSHTFMEVLEENMDLLLAEDVNVPDGEAPKKTKREGAYNEIAKAMKRRLDDGELLVKELDELLIAKEILEAKKKSKKRKGKK